LASEFEENDMGLFSIGPLWELEPRVAVGWD